jgi:hypothetical protein
MSDRITLAPPVLAEDAPVLSIMRPDGSPMVAINRDGSMEYGEGYDPDEAAREFWAAMVKHMPALRDPWLPRRR